MSTFSRAALIQQYGIAAAEVEVLKAGVDRVLERFADQKRYLYSSRIKSLASYLEKLETGRFRYANLDDLFACSLVVPRLPDIDECIKCLPVVIHEKSRRGPSHRPKEPETFRYDDWLLTCQMEPPAGITGDTVFTRVFELQVRTLMQYAWAEATHHVVYKGGVHDWRRSRLSAQLRALAEQADLLFAEFASLSRSKSMPASKCRKSDELTKVGQRLKTWMDEGLVPEEVQPASLGRLVESIESLCELLGNDASAVADKVEAMLRKGEYPRSLSVYQLFVGEALEGRSEPVDWDRLAGTHAILVTSELEDLYHDVRTVPARHRVSLQARRPPRGVAMDRRPHAPTG
jgi:ppGpp synthetase/RelA/SpoT-type nucleotidyltranferase